MQVKHLAAALAASLPLIAAAQSSVTVYGVLDAAVAVEDSGAANSNSHTVINSGNLSSSRFGFKGTEVLGDGLSALFALEGGVAIDTGAGDSALFGRRSVVGLAGNFGSVTVGREYTPIAAIAGFSDAFGQGFYGSNLSAFTANRLTRRISNSVNFASAPMSGFTARLAYSAGEKTVAPSNNLKAVSLEYANGPLIVGAGYQVINRLSSGDDKEYAFGASYKVDAFEFKGGYLVADQIGANNKFSQLNAGATYAFGPNKVYANLQQNKIETGAKGNVIAIAYSYALSKRTMVYTSYASLRNNNVATFGLNSSSTNVTPASTDLGADPSAFTIGMRHQF